MTLPGFRDEFRTFFNLSDDRVLGRIVEQNRHHYKMATHEGIVDAEIKGRLLFSSDGIADLPKVGDWVEFSVKPPSKYVIIRTLHRFSKLSRKVVGKRSDEQVLVTNVDQALVMQSADSTFNIRRVERFVVMAKESGADVAIALSKCDLTNANEMMVGELVAACPGIPIFPCSAINDTGIAAIYHWIKADHTVVILGPSGVGKSTLVNAFLAAPQQKTGDVNARHMKGSHTTVKRQLITLPNRGIIIDTPGIREIQLWAAEDGIGSTFEDIDRIAQGCRFSNCTHQHEHHCAVKNAVNSGQLSPDRLAHYQKLHAETHDISTVRQRLGDTRKKRHLAQAKKRYNTPFNPQQIDDD